MFYGKTAYDGAALVVSSVLRCFKHHKVAEHGKHFFIGFILGSSDLEEGVPVPVHWLKLQQTQLADQWSVAHLRQKKTA